MSEEIINGIDVSECKNFSCGICEEENKIPRTIEHFTADCIFYPNCYYKQLKRLQEENDELKEMLSKEPLAMQAFQTAYSGLKKDNEVLWGMVKDYKTALEEIKEDLEQDTTCESRECGCDDYGECLKCVKETMLDKINEVLKQ